MGAFVSGVFVGWLAEWLFLTFWIKGQSTGNFADCTALKNELSAKNKEIATLKSDLDKTKKLLTNTNDKSKATEKVEAKNSVATSNTTKVAAKGTSTKKAPAKKVIATKASVKKPSAKKAEVKSSTKKEKAAPTAKKTVAKKAPSKKKMSGDDLTKLSGIGPSMAATLNELGISTYKKLADMDDDILRDMLEASGARLNNNKEAMDTWNEQAGFADKGDMVSLKKLQDSLKK